MKHVGFALPCSVRSGGRNVHNDETDAGYSPLKVLRGYSAELTDPRRDDGYGICLYACGDHFVVECKCYNPTRGISRPTVQKLLGDELGKKPTLLTTATFSSDAREFASGTGVLLFDGSDLENMLQETFR